MWLLRKVVAKISPQSFWRMYAKDFFLDPWQHAIFPQQKDLLRFIKKNKVHTILEAGCGFGRNLQYLVEHGVPATHLHGVDITSSLLKKACQVPILKQAVLESADVLNLPYQNNNFDLVFTHGLLMHIPPKKIEKAFRELIRTSRKYVVIYEEVSKQGNINTYTYGHDYFQLAKTYKLKMLFSIVDNRKLLWMHLEK